MHGCRFDDIDSEAVKIHSSGGNPTGNVFTANVFRDVGQFSDDSSEVNVLQFDNAKNVSLANTFERSDLHSVIGGNLFDAGPVEHTVTLADNQSSVANVTDPVASAAVRFDLQRVHNVIIDYIIKRGTARRTGTINIAGTGAGIELSDDFTHNSATGITFSITPAGILQFTSTNTGASATFKYKISRFV